MKQNLCIVFLLRELAGGGTERAVCGLAGFFARQGHRVTIVTLVGSRCAYAVPEGVGVRHLNTPRRKRLLPLRQALRELAPHIVVGMSSVMAVYAVLGCLFTRGRAVGAERNNPVRHFARFPLPFVKKLFSCLANGYVFQTQAAQAYYPKSARKKSAVIPNALVNPLLGTFPPFLAQREPVVAAMGRLTPPKGFDLLLDAFALVANQLPGYRLAIWGEGAEKEALLAWGNANPRRFSGREAPRVGVPPRSAILV
jgi:glycosyltransferase involved in cell wall biosynthesis